jgi:ABC-type transport system involved in cytochrome bd biosynthesis fused ATPase/permease subunit
VIVITHRTDIALTADHIVKLAGSRVVEDKVSPRRQAG